jgi:hypothetical protein
MTIWLPTGDSLQGPPASPGLPGARVVVIEEPAANDQFFLWKNTTGAAVTISRLVATVRGAGSDFSFLLYHGPAWSGSGTAVVTGGTSCSNTTTGLVVSSFNNPTIADGHLLWIVITAVNNGPQQACVQIEF